jgi:hypothetical protein
MVEPGTGNRAMWSQTLAAAGAATEARKIYRAVCLSCRQTSSKSDAWRVAGGSVDRPSSFGIGADPGHHEHRRPSTNVPTEASGWRSTVRKSTARLVPQSGQKTSSHGVPAISAALIVGDHNISRPVAKCRFQRSTTSSASRRVAGSALSLAAPALMSSPHDGYRLRVRRWGVRPRIWL